MNINLTNLTVDEVNVILASLAKGPYEAVTDVIKKIRDQAMGQITPAGAAEGSPDDGE